MTNKEDKEKALFDKIQSDLSLDDESTTDLIKYSLFGSLYSTFADLLNIS
jgi:hypothetical protein